jgi:hypothetical protein
MLLVDDMLYKTCLMTRIVPFLESFDGLHGDDHYLSGFVFPYLENLQSFGYGVPTFVEDNPFGRVRCINRNDPRQFKMLFVKCSHVCQPSFCIKAKLKLKQKVPY